MTYNLICKGNIASTGGEPILENGFYYSGNTTGYTTCDTVQIGEFTATITGNAGTIFDIKSYAVNSVGETITSDTISVKTLGTAIPATISSSLNPTTVLYEVGTDNENISIYATITPNDEINLNSLTFKQDGVTLSTIGASSPFLTTYSQLFNFEPISKTGEITQNTILNVESSFGLYPPYLPGTLTQTIESVFPYLWTVDNTPNNTSLYYSNKTYYNTAGSMKLISQKGKVSFDVKLSDALSNYIHVGFPNSYGECTQILMDGTALLPTKDYNIEIFNVNGGLVNSWTVSYIIYNINVTGIVKPAIPRISLFF